MVKIKVDSKQQGESEQVRSSIFAVCYTVAGQLKLNF